MRISSYFDLGRTQPSLDFVDIDVTNDTRLFVSPRALMQLPSDWGNECVFLVQDFFETVLKLIKTGKQEAAVKLLRALREPNETHLGLSKGVSRGRALGAGSARDVWGALSRSEAAKSGLLQDLEETVLMVEGINVDIVSDIATSIIRGPLIQYTQQMCETYGIPMSEGIQSGPIWDPSSKSWTARFERLPVTPGGRLLLVPKVIVRQHLEYEVGEYFRNYVLEHLRQVELDAGSGLVELLKNKKRRVTKKNLMKKYGKGKAAVVRETLKRPGILAEYRRAKEKRPHLALEHEEIARVEGRAARPDWDALLKAVLSIPVGVEFAAAYEKAVEGLLTALFYPVLNFPKIQRDLHDGRKRIDISYTNVANAGFFQWVATHYPAPMIFVECKNYGKEVANPELDQLAGRFAPSRGQVGLLVCRQFANKGRFLERCRDTAKDVRGFILPLDDKDLTELVRSRKEDMSFVGWPLLRRIFESLIT